MGTRYRPMLVVLLGLAGPCLLPGSAAAQSLPGSPGIDYYPSWMHQGNPWVAGADQDIDPLPGDRFNRGDNDFQAWRAEQVRVHGTDYYRRPGYEDDYLNWRETREVEGAGPRRETGGAGVVTRDRALGRAEPTMGR